MNQWESRWEEGRIGFHLSEVNSYLIRHCDQFLNKGTENVFVPLCGKTLDIFWLSERSKKVVGVEFVRMAVESFFEENNKKYKIFRVKKFNLYKNVKIEIFLGDFFDLTIHNTGKFLAIYDRAAIVSMDFFSRQRYADHLMSFLFDGGKILLITLDYDQNQMTGPPYSVPVEEIEKLFSKYGTVELLETCDIIDDRLRNKGLKSILERVYLITKE